MTMNLVWIDVDREEPSEQAARVRAQAARDGRRRQRERKTASANIEAVEDCHQSFRKSSRRGKHGADGHGSEGKRWIVITTNPKKTQPTANDTESSAIPSSKSLDSHNATNEPHQSKHTQNELPMPIERCGMGMDVIVNSVVDCYFSHDSYRIPSVAIRHLTWLQPRSTSMEQALYAIGLLQISSTCPNEDVDFHARRHYGMMLQAFQHELKSPQFDFTAVIATALEVLLCQIYTTVSEDAVPWRRHITWMVRLVKQSGTCLFSSRLGHILYETACMTELVHSLFLRRPFRLDVSSWIETEPPPAAGSLRHLLRLATSLPSLLYQTDHITGGTRNITRLVSLASQLQELDTSFVHWMEDCRKIYCIRGEKVTFGISQGPPSRDLPIPVLEPTFRSELYFQSHHAANVHALYWQCLLLLRMAMQKVQTLLADRLNVETSSIFGDRDFANEACACANLLCRAIPFLLRSAGGNISKAASVRLPIFYARWFFEGGEGHAAELEWCAAAEKQLRDHFSAIHWDALLPWALLALIWQPFEDPDRTSSAVEDTHLVE